jgi:glycosyltransferase involved in cell wall biosynthesis
LTDRGHPSRLRVAAFRYYPAIGGAEHLTRRLVHEIGQQMQVDVVTLVTENKSDWLPLLVDGVRDADECYQVDGRQVRALARWPASVRRRLRRLAPFYHLPLSPAPGRMGHLLAPVLAGVAADADILHNIFMGREAFSAGLLEACQAAGTPFVFTPLRHQRPLGWNSAAFRALYRGADAVIALTRHEADWLIARGARPDRISVIGAGPLSDGAATPDAARRLLGDQKLVLFLGQLHPYKGFKVLLQAADRLRHRRDVRFVFAGPDVRGHARVFRHAPPNVTYLGAVPDALRDSLLQACTVLCVPSSRESFGLVLLEAWNSAKPVIGGPAPATRELIEDGVDGWSCPQEREPIVRRLTEVLEDEALALAMGRRGKRKVEEHFSWRTIADRHLAIYSRLQKESV